MPVFISAVLTLPWLFPLATGPSPGVQPWLFGLACAALAALLGAGRGVDWARVLGASVLAAGSISVGLGVVQFFGLEKPFAPWIASSFKGESFANLRQRNQFATLTVMAWFACAYFLTKAREPEFRMGVSSAQGSGERVHAGAGGTSWGWPTAAWLVVAAWLGLGTAISASRTGLAELLLATLVVSVWAWRSGVVARLWAALSAVWGGWGIGTLVLPLFRSGAETLLNRPAMGAEGCNSRLTLWQNVWQLSLEKPLAGWGFGSMKQAHYEGVFPAPRFCEILDNAHNLPLHLAFEWGLVAAGSFVVGTLWFLWRTWPATFARDHGFGAAHMTCGMLGVVLLHSMLEYPLWYAPFQTAALMAVGVLWVNRPRAERAGLVHAASDGSTAAFFGRKRTTVMVFVRCLAAILLAAAAFTAWEYHRVSQIYIEPEQRMAAYKADTLQKISNSWLFADQVKFADLAINPVTVDNAAQRLPLAVGMLRQSPEPRVIEGVLLGAYATGRKDLLAWHLPRYKAAFPAEYAAWAQTALGASVLAAGR